MTNIKHREKYNRFDSQIWKRTRVDSQGRVTIPLKVRKKLCLNKNSEVLWISVCQKNGKENEFLIELGIKK